MRLMTIILSFALLSGCGLLDQVNDTVDYGKEVKGYTDKMSGYADELSPYLDKKSVNEEDLQHLKGLMDEAETDIRAFNELEPPSVAEGIHGEIEHHNDQILEAIDEANRQMDSGQFDPSAFEEMELVKSIKKVQQYRDEIENVLP
ncbi:hypothetical protein CEY16_10830 [Halalkalibacillus sediminis]|uniref:Lipoprotein n=1 Tax=Halalkalibacillus sediminis TaxID=2018042 RepID=A0A2I0QSB9_9BACI|nr:DUF6376 family protein [Halalkalibacillus sediminis]PKR77226.1 hypothetical protein CEY16_10830 [Halalkalibacillus sediminis]